MMCRHPEIQRNAQREVDALTSEDNIPRMEDALKLPFVKCIMQELFRFAPPAPLLVHSPIEDDIYQGFLIPKGITCTERKSTYLISIRLNGDGKCLVGCISAILTRLNNRVQPGECHATIRIQTHSIPTVSQGPRPNAIPQSTFLVSEDGEHQVELPAHASDPANSACPGDEFTRSTLLLAFAQILWAFDISEAVDFAGNSVKPEVDYVGGYILQVSVPCLGVSFLLISMF
jgi:hypothetical protein